MILCFMWAALLLIAATAKVGDWRLPDFLRDEFLLWEEELDADLYNPEATRNILRCMLAAREAERVAVVHRDNRRFLIAVVERRIEIPALQAMRGLRDLCVPERTVAVLA